jgi:RNA polymerase sigma-70 factor (ECF subfamily)
LNAKAPLSEAAPGPSRANPRDAAGEVDVASRAGPLRERHLAAALQAVVPTTPQIADEAELAAKAAAGDEDAFRRIMRRYNQRLYRLAFGVMGEASEAEDVLQESWVRAYSALSHYAGTGSLGAWLARIVRNEAIDRLRARNSRRNHILLETELRRADAASGDSEEPLSGVERRISGRSSAQSFRSIDVADTSGMNADAGQRFDPEAATEIAEAKHLLEGAIARLPEAFRAAFMLREVEGLSVEEAAEYLGIPPGTVKTRDHRARLLLRSYLSARIDRAAPHTFAFLSRRCDELVARVIARLHS